MKVQYFLKCSAIYCSALNKINVASWSYVVLSTICCSSVPTMPSYSLSNNLQGNPACLQSSNSSTYPCMLPGRFQFQCTNAGLIDSKYCNIACIHSSPSSGFLCFGYVSFPKSTSLKYGKI